MPDRSSERGANMREARLLRAVFLAGLLWGCATSRACRASCSSSLHGLPAAGAGIERVLP
jgi:hypothetical protein